MKQRYRCYRSRFVPFLQFSNKQRGHRHSRVGLFCRAEIVHWQFDDPLLELDPEKQKRRFRSLRDQIAQRVRLFALVQTRFASIGTHAYQDPHSRADLIHTGLPALGASALSRAACFDERFQASKLPSLDKEGWT